MEKDLEYQILAENPIFLENLEENIRESVENLQNKLQMTQKLP